MIKKIGLITLLFVSVMASAQDVRYYQLVRKEKDGVSDRNVSGGLFITFVGKMCFESNNKGVGIDHGTMQLNTGYSNSNVLIYEGSSYWGKRTAFKFNSDKSGLNVIFDDGEIFIYKRATPPAGQTTCSLIRQKGGGSSSSGGGYTPIPDYPQQQYPQQQYPQQQNSPQPTPTPTPAPQQERRYPCSICNQTGEVIKDVTYSTHTKYCDKCHKTVFIGHVHGICTACGGKGYTK